MDRRRFEQIVTEALDDLPDPFATHMDNVHVVVEDEPSPSDIEGAGIEPGGTLYGLYQGVPQTERGPGYTFVLPDKITIFRGPILRDCQDEDDVYDEVITTVVHEIAHHFGVSEERLEELGW